MVKNQHCLTLKDRHIIEIVGDEATHFLQNLITTDIENLHQNELLPGALLSPQGKVLYDFLIAKQGNNYLIDISSALSDSFLKRLSLYKLRAKIEIISHFDWSVALCFSNDLKNLDNTLIFKDNRFQDKEIYRLYSKDAEHFNQLSAKEIVSLEKAWTLIRITYGIAESNLDFAVGDVFPHDINYDQIGGLSFKKGCYIGQEVISRMHHRATARRRMLVVHAKTDAPSFKTIEDTTIIAEGKPIGQLATHLDNIGLALMRIDKVKAAMDKKTAITIHNISLTVSSPKNMDYDFPQNINE